MGPELNPPELAEAFCASTMRAMDLPGEFRQR
jgi:hypothetical protein